MVPERMVYWGGGEVGREGGGREERERGGKEEEGIRRRVRTWQRGKVILLLLLRTIPASTMVSLPAFDGFFSKSF
jgi:hypothetical protein